jgi:hypothetical protein
MKSPYWKVTWSCTLPAAARSVAVSISKALTVTPVTRTP